MTTEGLGIEVDWVLTDELALGRAPRHGHDLQRLELEGISAVLSLCGEAEAPTPHGLAERFQWRRVPLPDHRSGRSPHPHELAAALAELRSLRRAGMAVYVHCVAAQERSPLLCMAWLMQERGLSRLQALDYLMQVHPSTRPLPGQLALLTPFPIAV